MEQLSGVMSKGYILAHNGILSNFLPTDSRHSDTEELVRCLANLKCDIMGEDLREIIDLLIDGSRVAILNTNGTIKRYGSGWTLIDGIYYSNTYFRYSSYSRSYSRYYDYYDEYDEYDAYNSAYYSPEDTTPKTEELDELMAGEIVKHESKKEAYMNVTDGSYYVDRKTKKLYGAYKGSPYDTKYVVCDCLECMTCDYKCPYRESGG
mgnify:CR=1 FL=1